ncbi:OsmC family protein [Halosquirtibacter laminarini]|uniref:OsmC family protein n=1 Tax=Halosquirtibacter laminarini TaxID=3374600 RepID=A0AC61NES0_9BACT|nr:OsmC family protein [Prolixibacteraceae bacterium]
MTTANSIYLGDLRIKSTHLASEVEILSDAPVDNCGKGEAFSPTDMVATAFANCMLTIIGIGARDRGIDIVGTRAEVTKVMISDPRRIFEIKVDVYFPNKEYSEEDKLFLADNTRSFPVGESLNPSIIKTINYYWSEL